MGTEASSGPVPGLPPNPTESVSRATNTGLPPSASAPLAPAFLVWQLADSALPTGGFAHSNGLEAARQIGEVRTRVDLENWLLSGLEQLTFAALPFVNEAHACPDRFPQIDALCDAFNSNHVANRASRAQGRALLALVRRALLPESGRPLIPPLPDPEYGHLAPLHGLCMARLGLEVAMARSLFAFQFLRGALASAVRLNLVGPLEAQVIQTRLNPRAEAAAGQAAALTLQHLAQTAPLLDLLQAHQDRLHSRLFQS